jgi:hypothetical protein
MTLKMQDGDHGSDTEVSTAVCNYNYHCHKTNKEEESMRFPEK